MDAHARLRGGTSPYALRHRPLQLAAAAVARVRHPLVLPAARADEQHRAAAGRRKRSPALSCLLGIVLCRRRDHRDTAGGGGGPVRCLRRRERVAPARLHGREDRKSTRLNSSHVKISYAVFCLKKKTNKP